jgi:hypothetical protein
MIPIPVEVSRASFEAHYQGREAFAGLLLEYGIVKIRDEKHDT